MFEGLSHWLETTTLHRFGQDHGWFVPAAQTVHILAISVVIASGLVIALRLLGWRRGDWAPQRWARRLGGWMAGALIALLLSGATLVAVEPERELLNPIFRAKLLLVLIAVALNLLLWRRLARLGPGTTPPAGVRLLAVAAFVLWLAIIAAGRWIAYAG